jgi:hypothetical protein
MKIAANYYQVFLAFFPYLKLSTMKKLTTIVAATMLLFISCSKTATDSQAVLKANSMQSAAQSSNLVSGVGSAIPAYYDSSLLKIMFVEFSPQAEATQIARNKSINFIYQSDPGLPNNQPFISVIDAIPGDGFNPVWREVQIVFNAGFTPRQLYSDNEVLAAASGVNPEITLNTTNEVYWCPVIGKK